MHKNILLDNYLPELSVLHSFYKHSETAFSDQNLYSKIVNEEISNMIEVGKDFLDDPINGMKKMQEDLNKKIPEKVASDIGKGLAVLRRQLLEAAHSIFEKFLCHVLRVYLYTFPQILKNIDKSINYSKLVDLVTNTSVFDFMVEREIEHFSHRSLQEKKDYFTKRLHMHKAEKIWVYEGEELWKDIDKKRQAIVHNEEVLDISPDYLIRTIFFFQRAMVGITLRAQAYQGIPFVWGEFSHYVKKRKTPKL